MKKVDKFYLS